MQIAMFGGTGFVGSHIVDALLTQGHSVQLLVRAGSEPKIPRPDSCVTVTGDLASDLAIADTLRDCSAVIYSVGILDEVPSRGITFEALQYEGAVKVAGAAKAAGITRFLLMSANGVRAGGTPYQDTKFRAEQFAREQNLDYTIFRPSVIFGDPRGRMEFATQLCKDMVRPPLPAIDFRAHWSPASPSVRMSPVHVTDVADAFVEALAAPRTIGQTYELGGPEELNWNSIIHRIAAAIGRKKLIIPMPVPLMKVFAQAFGWIPGFPVTKDQLTMLAENNTAGHTELETLIGRKAASFDKGSLAYLNMQ